VKIIVSHVYSSDNKGDAALASVLLRDIERQYPGAEVTLLTFEKFSQPTYEGARQLNSFMYHALTRYSNKAVKLLYAAYVSAATLLWAVGRRTLGIDMPLPRHLRQIAREYASADMVITVGGGYIRSGRSVVQSINLFLQLHPLVFGRILKKPTVIYTQSIGPFYRGIERWAVAAVLKRMDLVILREDFSRQLLEKLGVTGNVVRSVDSGFLLETDKTYGLRKQLGVGKKDILVGVTVRKWLSGAGQQQYETAIAHTIDYMIETYKATVVFIPQVTATFHHDDDREASRDVHRHLRHKEQAHIITDDIDHYDIKAMYNELDLIIGTRFHSVIFSLTSRVPALAIEYEHKTSGIMHDLGLDEWVMKIEDVTPERMQAKIDELFASHHTYTAHLESELPAYIEKAKEAIVLTDGAYRKTLREID